LTDLLKCELARTEIIGDMSNNSTSCLHIKKRTLKFQKIIEGDITQEFLEDGEGFRHAFQIPTTL
jgi:hypothetical protein